MKLRLTIVSLALAALLSFGVLTAPSQAASISLTHLQSCQPDGSVKAVFAWQGNSPAALQQWVDLSLFNNGWLPGTFYGSGPLPAAQQSLSWSGLQSGAWHYIRVNQLLPGGVWDASETLTFQTMSCPQPDAVQPAPAGPTVSGPPPLLPLPADRQRVLAPIDSAEVMPPSANSGLGPYFLSLQVGLPSGCAQPAEYEVSQTGNNIVVKVYNSVPISGTVACTAIYGSYALGVRLPFGLVPGQTYHIDVNGTLLDFMA